MDRGVVTRAFALAETSRRGLAFLLTTTSTLALAAHPARDTANEVLEEVTVASTPLGGLELPIDRMPGNIQRATSRDLDGVHGAGLAQFIDRRLGSVFINEAQANPLQPDVQFRGFVASPLLGQPQGMAVYQNGVRINDPFGDVVNWALVPEPAIASIDLIPGSNPVFGLNTLGGALSIRTKNGFTDPGAGGEVLAGSHGRTIAEVESGGSVQDRLSYYVSARYLTEDGWRNHSPSDAMHVFGDVGWRNDASEIALNLTVVETDLIGNGPAPIQLLDIEREAIYTHPDRTENSLVFVTLAGSHRLAPEHELQGALYLRRSDIDTLNGDESFFEECESDPAFVCEEGEDEFALDPHGDPIAFSPALDGATLNRSATNQDTYGASAQYGLTTPLAGRENRLIVGGSVDRSDIRFGSGAELASFDAGRGAIPAGVLVADTFVGLDARTENLGAFFTDTFAVTPRLDLTLAGRYNDSRVELRDQIGVALSGDHDFSRFNGAVGATYRLQSGLRLYANYSESNRAPSPVELTCADPDDPCALPNAFLSDPPLAQVVARTMEAGASGSWRSLRWHTGLFRTTNDDDIIFISAGALTNTGFFDNVGTTQRQGLEVNLNGRLLGERLQWFAHFTQLDAEFLEDFRVSSPNNPLASAGEIEVRNGARIPGVPEQLFKAGASMQFTPALAFSIDLLHQSNQHLRGDEGNLNAPLSGFTVLNAGAQWRLNSNLLLFAQIDNALDADYATFGLFGEPDEVLGDEFDDPRFISPGAPRSAWLGFRWTL
ncbi:MAG: TonB-dependent receptor [Steroidobacter sp.]